MSQNKGKDISAATADGVAENADPKPICGIIMPISAMPPKYDAAHWNDVRKVINKSIVDAGMHPQIVSDDFESDVIQRRIIKNLYENPVVVCDVSGLNPNVMFELGMRITFKKPIIIVTDDVGSIPFDTRIIEHLPYPSGLHIHETHQFMSVLTEKIILLYEKYQKNTFRSFIEDFGKFETLEPKHEFVGVDRLILDKISELESSLRKTDFRSNSLRFRVPIRDRRPEYSSQVRKIRIHLNSEVDGNVIKNYIDKLRNVEYVEEVSIGIGERPSYYATVVIEYDARSIEGERLVPIIFDLMPNTLRSVVTHSDID